MKTQKRKSQAAAKRKVPKTSVPRIYEGLPVVDADEDLKLSVTPADVAGSKKHDPAECAAARSLTRTLGTEAKVFLSRTYIKDAAGKCWVRFVTPQAVGREIVSFDRGSSFEPGEYTIKAPSPATRLGHYRGVKTHPENGTYKRQPQHMTVAVRGFDPGHLKATKQGKASVSKSV